MFAPVTLTFEYLWMEIQEFSKIYKGIFKAVCNDTDTYM